MLCGQVTKSPCAQATRHCYIMWVPPPQKKDMEKETLHEDEDGAWNDASFLSELNQVEAETALRLSGGGHSSSFGRALGRVPLNKRGRSFGDGESVDSTPHASSLHSDRDTASQPNKKQQHAIGEGEYMAALRGNHSETWQAMYSAMLSKNPATSLYGGKSFNSSGNVNSSMAPNISLTGACYKCGKDGHWAKDCTLVAGAIESFDAGSSFPDKKCRCGAGICTILTANTDKNPGRKFYRCPLKKDEGDCGFFEWCDSIGTGASPAHTGVRPLEFVLKCPCGAGPCVQLTAKTEKNMGRQFFRCPLNQGEGYCGFFKWCDEAASDTNGKSTGYVGENKGFPGKPAASNGCCFKCGMDGHWANDCPSKPASEFGSAIDLSSTRSFVMQGTSGVSGTCFKCGQAGHWSNNCTSQRIGSFPPNSAKGAASGHCYKCGMEGHWSTNCPENLAFSDPWKSGNTQIRGSGSGGFGNNGCCYKCGGQGHWAKNCTAQVGSLGHNKVRGSYGRS